MPDIKVTLDTKPCPCGSVYAVPHWIGDYGHTCPMCAKRQIRAAINSANEETEKLVHMERQIASLRGVITRMKRANGARS